jgi:hypothetical protein
VILHLKTVSISGGPVKISDAAIGAFRRSFLQHFDLILGWIFNHTKRQRIVNMASNTIVVMSFCESSADSWSTKFSDHILESEVGFLKGSRNQIP